ncbi:MAG: hypothetical protein HQK75_06805 [Candidatus Magnetomorum sp.]|nr:hypothetical protein [Candidatus Magnetomorum sp.]
MIKTLTLRLADRFKPEALSETQPLPVIYLTSADVPKGNISNLCKTIINDLRSSLQKERLIVRIPPLLDDNATEKTSTECDGRFFKLDRDIDIVISIQPCTSTGNCSQIVLDISQEKNKVSETCHLAMTSALEQKNHTIFHIPNQMGQMKKPFRSIEEASTNSVDLSHCLLKKLLPEEDNPRFLMAKTDLTPLPVFDAIKTEWEKLLGMDRIAQTVIPIDFYGETFVVRDTKISESIPKDIKLLVAIDAIEISPGQYRIRCHLLSLAFLYVQLLNHPAVPFGECIPGCQFNFYTHTSLKGNFLTGSGTGDCLKKVPPELWSYSAKTLAEKAAQKNLSDQIKNLLRKHYILENKTYFEDMLDEKVMDLMRNASLEWEQFDEKNCSAEARFIIHESLLPFALNLGTSEIQEVEEKKIQQLDAPEIQQTEDQKVDE